MFDNIGKRIQTFLLILLIVLLSLVMGIVGFGGPTMEGCATEGAGYAAQVYDETISEGEFRAAYTVTGFVRMPTERAQTLRLKQYTLDGLIERELLVREGRRIGFTADPDEVFRKVADDEVILLGGPVDAPEGYPAGALQQPFRDREGAYSADYLRRIIQFQLRRSIEEFTDWQVKETIANDVREAVMATVAVSPREVWDSYVQDTERAQLNYVRFDPAYFRDQVDLSDEAITAWMQAHQEEVDAEYRLQRHAYTGLEEETRARQILLEVSPSASEADRAAARAQAEALLARAVAGEDFVALARQYSTEEGSAARGGDTGWFPRGRHPAALEEPAFAAEPGSIVETVIETPIGFHVVKILGHRSGDVPEADAKREVAENLYTRARAGELAREQADRALAYLRDGHSMEELNERLRHDWAAPATPPAEGEDAEPEDEAPRAANAPQVRETLNFARAERAVSGPFDSGPLTLAAFEMSAEEPLPEEPMQLGDSWFVYRLIERAEATEEGFDEETQERIEQRLLAPKRREVLSAYIGRLRAAADAEGAIVTNEAILSYGSEGSEDEEAEETASR